MAKLSKKDKLIKEKVIRSKQYPLSEALQLLKEFGTAKFNESIDVSVNLGVDPRKSDQMSVAQPYCRTAQVKWSEWQCLHKDQMQMLQ